MILFLEQELVNTTRANLNGVTAFTVAAILGVWLLALQLKVQLSDPGVLIPLVREHSADYRAECLNLGASDRARFATDPIYIDSDYYTFRNCTTCRMTRTPKASHCDSCGHCVQGWDHHCDLLNNCIG